MEIIYLKEKCLQTELDAQNYIKNALEDIQAQMKIKIERQQKVIQDFETQQILSFIEIERICLNNNELQQQVEYFRNENNKLKSVKFIKNLSLIKGKK